MYFQKDYAFTIHFYFKKCTIQIFIAINLQKRSTFISWCIKFRKKIFFPQNIFNHFVYLLLTDVVVASKDFLLQKHLKGSKIEDDNDGFPLTIYLIFELLQLCWEESRFVGWKFENFW